MTRNGKGLLAAWYRGAWWLWLLRPLEWVFRAVAALRRGLYRARLLPRYRAPKPVVVVGNIAVGGTGKTPVVIALVEALQAQGIRVGVVSRGYGASRSKRPRRVRADSSAQDCGDEPLLIHRRTGCPCVVARDRAAAVRQLLAEEAVDIVLCDDGLQHYRLARDLEIALVDARQGHGNGHCLPAGPLREPVSRLQSVDFVLQRGGEGADDGVRYEARSLVHLETGETCSPDPVRLGARVHAVAGIGHPRQFFALLDRLGFRARGHAFPDHHPFSAGDFEGLSNRPIIMTEKDAVKCAGIAGPKAWYLKIDARLPARVVAAVLALARS